MNLDFKDADKRNRAEAHITWMRIKETEDGIRKPDVPTMS